MLPEAEKLLSNSGNSLSISILYKYKPYVFIVDQAIRVFALYLYLHYQFSSWWLFLFNAILIVIIGFIADAKDGSLKTYYSTLIEKKYLKYKISVKTESSAPESLALLYIVLGIVFNYWFLYNSTGYRAWYSHIFFAVVSLFGASVYIMILLFTDIGSPKRHIKGYKVNNTVREKTTDVSKYFPDILSNLKSVTPPENVLLDPVDYNDTQIAKLESKLKSSNNRVDAYLLESVLLGGLAFSGFLTVVSSNILNNESKIFGDFCQNAKSFYNKFSSFSDFADVIIINQFFHRSDLFILIMFLCLFSSVFFLLVLTLRMRYMSLSLEMDHLMRVMVIFNAKEEELTNIHSDKNTPMSEPVQARLRKISKKIDFAISDAEKLMNEFSTTVRMMSLCRNFAVSIFYTVLVVSGFYFSPTVAYCILMIAVLLFAVRWIETLIKKKKIKNLLSRHK